MKRTLLGAAMAGSLLVTMTPGAQARDGIGPGGAAALGVLGGLAIGGAIASSQNNGYYPGRPVYREPRPVYVEEEVCHMERRGYIDAYGDEHIRRVRVCE
ncbi:hypothetical protein [Methylobacterium sp. J-090]|uniref:hypothetical protein n=1 Tax=Methylobacterium sp. J-090 TaxID=2836666 RepID=UPI001FB8CDA1|nr:hypothetical protein [Methylobacterium sp. J-090]MCJ2080205.1 hypothetical protein [Methylobacterium sp. J-090]